MDKEKIKLYRRKYILNRYRIRRATAINSLGGKCKNCGSNTQLEFDHIDPSTKLFTIGKLSSCSNEKFWNEISKCQLLCNDCHKEKTLQDKNIISPKKTHGTLSSYRYCHCVLCKKVKNDWMKEYRKIHPRKKYSGIV